MKTNMNHNFNTRRSFIKGVILAGVAPYVMKGSSLLGQDKPAGTKVNVACIGLGGIIGSDLPCLCNVPDVNVVALCDVDERALKSIRGRMKSAGVREEMLNQLAAARDYTDYRELLSKEKELDAVIVATPDHWHAPICTAFIKAGKHVYCEKPLTHTVGEARTLRELAKSSPVITQMGNQGGSSGNMRRNLEVLQAGLLGQIREVHIWHPPYSNKYCGVDRPTNQDPVPEGLNWDFWLGPAKERPYVNGAYHPFSWRYWYDFGNGSLGDFCGHAFNLPVQALKLDHPTSIEVSAKGLGKESYITEGNLLYKFPARDQFDPVNLYFYHAQIPPAHALEGIKETFGNLPTGGCVLIGDNGTLSAGLWNTDSYLKMKGEEKFKAIGNHSAAKDIPKTLPRVRSHIDEWIEACRGNGSTCSHFDLGGLITEIGLVGILALRTGHEIKWDGVNMKSSNSPEVDAMVHVEYRKNWLM